MTTHNHDILMAINSRIINGRSGGAKQLNADYKALVKARDEIIKMRKAQLQNARSKLAAWMIAKGYATGHGDTTEDLLKELEWQVRESEREACAKWYENAGWLLDESDVADAIRART
jgi:hypothetical protein